MFVIIQARMSSKRLPGKSLAKIGEHFLLEWVILRILSQYKSDEIFLATTINKNDDQLVGLAEKYGLNIFRGQENNVLSRFQSVAKLVGSNQMLARVCADNPFVSASLLVKTEKYCQINDLDYCHSLKDLPVFPYVDGLGSEVFKSEAILRLQNYKLSLSNREHVTSFMRTNFNLFKIDGVPTPIKYRFPKISLDVDTLNDLSDIRNLVQQYKLTPFTDDIEIIKAANNFVDSSTIKN